MVAIKLDNHKIWALIVSGIAWVLYIVAMGTAWYRISSVPSGSDSGAGAGGYTTLEISRIFVYAYDDYGNTISKSYSWASFDLFWSHSVLRGAYSFAVLVWVCMTFLLFILILNIFDINKSFFKTLVRALTVCGIIFGTLTVIIFPGITLAFSHDETNARNTDGNVFISCTSACTDSFVGEKTSDGYTQQWFPYAAWACVVFAWPFLIGAAYLFLKKITFGEESPASAKPGVALEAPN